MGQTALFQLFRETLWFDEQQQLLRDKCRGCGRSSVERRVPLTRDMIHFLGPLSQVKHPVHKRELVGKISNVTYSCAHYLRSWGLIRTHDPAGRQGPWEMTHDGHQFLHGAYAVPRWAVISECRLIRFEGDLVRVFDFLETKDYEAFRLEYLSAVDV